MTGRSRADVPGEPAADPFQEKRRCAFRFSAHLLGALFHFETDSRELLRLAKLAFEGVPPHKFPGHGPQFAVKLVLHRSEPRNSRRGSEAEPPSLRTAAGSTVLCGALESANFVAVTAAGREALVVVSRDMLRFPYHVRYELLEFAVYTLAARAQSLVPLHGACVGTEGAGLLLLGPSGAGKSTLSLNCLLQGLEFVAEDSVLVRPRGLLATGLANFLHMRRDSSVLPAAGRVARAIRNSPIIRRRSGVEKWEIDLRRPFFHLAPSPLPVAAVILVSDRSANGDPLLRPLRAADLLPRLVATQRYAAGQPGWKAFTRQVASLPAYELLRGRKPVDSAQALRELLGGNRHPRSRK